MKMYLKQQQIGSNPKSETKLAADTERHQIPQSLLYFIPFFSDISDDKSCLVTKLFGTGFEESDLMQKMI